MSRALRYGGFVAASALVHYLVIAPPSWPFGRGVKAEEKAALVEIAKVAREVETVRDALEEKAKELEKKLAEEAPKAAPAPPPPPPPPAPKPEPPKPAPEEPEARYADNVKPPEPPKPEVKEDRRLRELEERLAEAEAEKRRLEDERARAEREKVEERRRADEEKAALARRAEDERRRAEAEKAELTRRADEAESERVAAARKADAEKADLVRRAEAEKREIARRAEEERAREEARRRAAEQEAAAADRRARDASARAEREERALAERMATLGDAREAEQANIDVTRVPALAFRGGQSEQAYVDLQRFYGMKVIVYPPSRRFLATVDLASGELEAVTDEKAFLSRFNRRAIFERGAFFDAIAARVAARFGGRAEDLTVATILPHRTARYLGWKELEVCRRARVDPTAVSQAVATYERRADGGWIVRITELHTWDARRIVVTDFEGRS
jgi:hypothetical protein